MRRSADFPRAAAPEAPPKAPKAKPARKPKARSSEKPRLAPQYRVLIHNDDVTPMDFVVTVLREIFRKGPFEATRIMLTAHVSGIALVAVLPLEEAELRVDQAHSLARTAHFPLTFSYEPAEA
ncbi:MAG: ATP-dependent Clp protease adaptor ClpS [Planctomycetota bacterium]|nr:ATP-dependent Clp protease adaptor ClpS [Planctomycetota bacterium]